MKNTTKKNRKTITKFTIQKHEKIRKQVIYTKTGDNSYKIIIRKTKQIIHTKWIKKSF